MTMLFETFVHMEPVAKGRPRVTRIGAFTPTKTKNAEHRIAEQVAREYNGGIKEGPLMLILTVCLLKPASRPKKKPCYPVTRPDLDNYLKLVQDSLNGIVWKDDSQIIACTVVKKYSGAQGFELKVYEVPYPSDDDKEASLQVTASLGR